MTNTDEQNTLEFAQDALNTGDDPAATAAGVIAIAEQLERIADLLTAQDKRSVELSAQIQKEGIMRAMLGGKPR